MLYSHFLGILYFWKWHHFYLDKQMHDFLFFPSGKVTACKELVLKQIFFFSLSGSLSDWFLPVERCDCRSPLGTCF